jgi:hypothetical protein
MASDAPPSGKGARRSLRPEFAVSGRTGAAAADATGPMPVGALWCSARCFMTGPPTVLIALYAVVAVRCSEIQPAPASRYDVTSA